MKKKILIPITTCVIVICIAAYAMLDLYSFRDDLVIKAKTIKGHTIEDSDVKINLTINGGKSYHYDKNVCKSSFKIQDKPNLKTEFLHNNQVLEKPYFYLEGANFSVYHHLTSIKANEKDKAKQKELVINTITQEDNFMDLADFQKKIFENMILNDQKNEVSKVKDYMDYLPVKISCSEPIYNKNISDAPDEEYYNKTSVADYFKFPVKDDMRIKTELNYYSDFGDFTIEIESNIMSPYSTENEEYGEEIYNMYTTNNKDLSSLYIAFEDGENYQIPKEYKGVYKLNLKKEEGREYKIIETITHKYGTVLSFNSSEIEKVYQAKDDEIIKNIFINNTGDLCVLSQIDKSIQLTYLDSNNYDTICILDLSDDKHKFVDLLIGQNGLIASYEDYYFKWIDDQSRTVIMDGKQDLAEKIKNKQFVHDKHEYYDFIYDNNKVYFLNSYRTNLKLNIVDKEGNSKVVEYSFPLKLNKHALEYKKTSLDDFYTIEKAAFSK